MAKVLFRTESIKKIVTSEFGQKRTANKLRILVVDDNEGVRNILNEYLSRCGSYRAKYE